MTVRKILTEPNKLLRQISDSVEKVGKEEQMLMDDMPVLPIYTYTTKHLVHPSVKNLSENIMDQQSYRELYLEGSQD